MPIQFARQLTGSRRSIQADRRLGWLLAFVAGALNAGGFLAVRQYTSHVTGSLSSAADHAVLGHWDLVADGVIAVLAFLLGALCCALLVNLARRRQLRSEFAIVLLLEAGLILLFGLMGAWLSHHETLFVPMTVLLLCFIMGLQNAVITKLSNAVIRTTHMTGVVTDLGIELGRLLYVNRRELPGLEVRADRTRLRVLAGLLAAFSGGGLVGAWGFDRHGYVSTLPLAALVAALALMPALDDVRQWLKAAPPHD
ncbi:uncharacterized membrane protein YoaK (UPF0700 family) [Inhella inkyongensis]|uniref:Uncharacterized membrane protein YoaK (UPF0700 family) n=1 Tax=Inhella inkyongensis TaxID=392593 RepID=A0A840S0Z4_9BURK|nr:YoaK family protein [Inhella inkyongensis]MBB5202746.1 uncharacterized membrane protein YoaK (UPF0700 family) [Inhella inkyongensis]